RRLLREFRALLRRSGTMRSRNGHVHPTSRTRTTLWFGAILRCYADDYLAEVLAAEKSDESTGRVLQPVNDVLAVLDPAVADHRGDLRQEVRLLISEVQDDEAPERQPLDEDLAHEHRDAVEAFWRLGVVIVRD